jgi:catechol 2,3-dioxygenase-like lactoylglutathione lyase family enzyme
MTFSLDHAVIAVRDLDQAISGYEKLGFTVLRGGEHPRRGSVNALIVFQDGTYFELIAFPKPVPGFRWWEVLQKAGPGFIDFALLPANMESDLEEAKARGFQSGPIEPGGRVTAEGKRAEWQTARPPASDLPFLCGDISPRPLRVPEGAVRDHANGALGIAKIVIAVSNLAKSTARYRALLPQGAVQGENGSAARFLCEPGMIELREPKRGAPEAAELAAHLDKRGEGPFLISLRAAQGSGYLDPAMTQGAKLRFVSAANPYL